MKARSQLLLAIDAAINLLLGLLLLVFPAALLPLLGLPPVDTHFYPSILGAVIFGIGVALCLQLRRRGSGTTGLRVEGAIAINFCGAGALVAWLLFGRLSIPMRGHITLWTVAIAVLAIGVAETATALRQPERG